MVGRSVDRFPQPLKFEKAWPNATEDVSNTVQFPLILPRKETANTRIVTEITRVIYDFSNIIGVFASANQTAAIKLSYRQLTSGEAEAGGTAEATIGNEAILDTATVANLADGTEANFVVVHPTISHDLSDGGLGILIPGDKLFIALSDTSDQTAAKAGVAIYYRQHLVGLTEYLGIIAARQQQS